MYYDLEGKLISFEEWTNLQGDKPVKIAHTCITDKADFNRCYEVSTIWVGLDYSCGLGGILIFETMIFGNGELDRELDRYTTREESLIGHRAMVAMASAEMVDPVIINMDINV